MDLYLHPLICLMLECLIDHVDNLTLLPFLYRGGVIIYLHSPQSVTLVRSEVFTVVNIKTNFLGCDSMWSGL
jgi:hypothetical protein